jgi:hypothetical protein
VYIEDEFIYVEDILEEEPRRIIVRRDAGVTGEMPVPALAIETGVNPGEQPKIPPTYKPGCAEEPEDAVQTEEIVNEKNLRVATSMVSTSKNPDIRRMLKLFPLHVVPLAIADIIHKLKYNTKSSRNAAHGFLTKISSMGGREEKEKFMRRITSKECRLDLATVMCDISYEDFEPISTLSSDFANTIKLLFLQPELRDEMLQICRGNRQRIRLKYLDYPSSTLQVSNLLTSL